jgi:hypothetical protein
MFEAAGVAISHILTWQVMLALSGGVILGVLSGALPGGAVPTLVVLLGFAYGMDPFIALPLAIGMVAAISMVPGGVWLFGDRREALKEIRSFNESAIKTTGTLETAIFDRARSHSSSVDRTIPIAT